jgi:hypothetical protein
MQLKVVLRENSAVPSCGQRCGGLSSRRRRGATYTMTSSQEAPSCQHTCRLMPSTENPLRNIEHSQERVCSASEVRVRSHFFVKSHGGFVPGPTPACSIAFLVRSLKQISEQGKRTYSRPCSGRVRRTPFAAATPSLRRRTRGPAGHMDLRARQS